MNRLIKSAASALFAMSTLALLSCEDDSDVIGLNDAAKYGYIKVTLEGEDPNGEDFEVTRNFKFAPSGTPRYTSSVYTYDDDGYYQEFDVTRYLGPINGQSNDYADLYMYHESTTPDFESAELYIQTVITTKNKEFFSFSRSVNFDAEDVTDYKYNPDTGKLSLKFKTEVSTFNGPVTVTATINVTVFEDLTPQFD